MRSVGFLKEISGWKKMLLIFACFSPFILMGASGCDGSDDDKSRREDTAQREENFSRAEQVLPVPTDLHNFPMRESLIKMTERQDRVNVPYYIYIYSDFGDPIGYYIGQTYPQSMCNFLSSSEKLVDVPNDGDSIPDFIVTAPSLDGIFYGGGGASSACNTMFFFDFQTDAFYTFNAGLWQASDKPIVGFEGPQLGDTSFEDVETEATPAS